MFGPARSHSSRHGLCNGDAVEHRNHHSTTVVSVWAVFSGPSVLHVSRVVQFVCDSLSSLPEEVSPRLSDNHNGHTVLPVRSFVSPGEVHHLADKAPFVEWNEVA